MEAKQKEQLGDELHRACSEGNLDAIREFIEHQKTRQSTYAPPLTTMMEVATNRDQAQVVSWCLEHGGTVNDAVMRTLVGGRAFETHKVLIEAKAIDIDYYVSWFGTVLAAAAVQGDHVWAKFCLERGANPDYNTPKPVDEYKTILAGAAENGHVEVVRLLLESGAKLAGSGALPLAAEAGKVQVIQFLLDSGDDIDVNEMGVEHPTDPRETEEMGSALHKAAAAGHKKIVELLIDRGADVQLKDVQGRTPLQLARANSHSEIIEALSNADAS